jgi:hypothetical protein
MGVRFPAGMGYKGLKGIKGRIKECTVKKQGKNRYPLNFNGPFPPVQLDATAAEERL